MKRLLCIVGNMNMGGAETFMMKIYRNINRDEYQIDFLVAEQTKGFYDNEIEQLGGRIYRVVPKSEGLIKNFRQIKKIVRDNQYEFILRISQHALSSLELLAAKRGGARLLAFRSSNTSTTSKNKINKFLHWLFRIIGRKFSNVKLAPSSEAAEFMFGKKAYKKGKVDILHNGVDLGVYHFDENGRKNIRQKLNISDDVTVVGHVGRLMEQKNHRFLLEVFAKIHEKNPNTILLLVGKGALENQLREQAAQLGLTDAVIFAGVRSDVPQMLSAMDVFVFPSFYEGMPNTVIEAQATGLPCVIADTITREADITGLVEYLSLNDSVEHWAEVALCKVATKRKDTKEDFIAHKYDIQSVTEQFVSLVFAEK